jgi:hypothetical protein
MKSWTIQSFSETKTNASLIAFDGNGMPWFYSSSDCKIFNNAEEIYLPHYIQDVISIRFLVFERIWVLGTTTDIYAYQNDEWENVGGIEDGIKVCTYNLISRPLNGVQINPF